MAAHTAPPHGGEKRASAQGQPRWARVGIPCVPYRAGAPAAAPARAIAPRAASRAAAAPQKVSRALALARRWRAFQCPIGPRRTGGCRPPPCPPSPPCACLCLPCHHCPEPALLVCLSAPAIRGRRAGCGRPLQDLHPLRRGRAGGRAGPCPRRPPHALPRDHVAHAVVGPAGRACLPPERPHAPGADAHRCSSYALPHLTPR